MMSELIKRYPNKLKGMFLPNVGNEFIIGKVKFRVNHINVGKLRFSAEVVGLISEQKSKVPFPPPPGYTTDAKVGKDDLNPDAK